MTENAIRTQSTAQIENRTGDACCVSPSTTVQTWLAAGDVMTDNIATVAPDCTVVSAAKIMWRNNISCLVVADSGSLLGIVTETDMLKRTVADGNDFSKMKVDEIMSSPVRSVPRELSVHRAMPLALDWPQPVDRLSQGIHYPAKQWFANGHLDHASRALDQVPGLDAFL